MARGAGLRGSAAVLAAASVLGAASLQGASGAVRAPGGVYTGYAFETCTAPSLTALDAWRTSPYRGLGIYIGGINRACADGNLSPTWVASAQTAGWSLFPLYVGLQAPCVAPVRLARIAAASAAAQGAADADDAVGRAGAFGLLAGSPIYFDLEGYATNDPGCSNVVRTFLSAWITRVHARGYVAGVYGSAASTIRDLQSVAPLPDDVWIADWSGAPQLFGNRWVSDALWTNHQRIHQFKGGHKETYGGVTLNIDSDYADASAVGPLVTPPAPLPPAPVPAPPTAGSVGSGDSGATASWPQGSIPQTAVVTLSPTTPPQPPPGFASGGYALTLAVNDSVTSPPTPLPAFALPLTIRIAPRPGVNVPYVSTDGGSTWQALPLLATPSLPANIPTGYLLEPDGTIDVLTLVPGTFALAADTQPPKAPVVHARFLSGKLRLSWGASTDNSGAIASYQVLLDGVPTATLGASARLAVLHAFHPDGLTVYRVRAVDPAGNLGSPSPPVAIVPTLKPAGLPRPIPQWAWALFAARHGERTVAGLQPPKPLPAWYRRWAAWRLQPFRLRG